MYNAMNGPTEPKKLVQVGIRDFCEEEYLYSQIVQKLLFLMLISKLDSLDHRRQMTMGQKLGPVLLENCNANAQTHICFL